MQEKYASNTGIKRLSRAEIRKMKENMQKVPFVQEQAERYHRSEAKQAEQLLENIQSIENQKPIPKMKKQEKKIWFLQKLKNYLFW